MSTAAGHFTGLTVATGRLTLLACPAPVARALTLGPRRAEALLNARLAPGYPSQNIRTYLPFYARQIEQNPTDLGWGIWLILVTGQRVLIGDIGFKGAPGLAGTVDIGYGIVPGYRQQGYATEAALALRDWAFDQPAVRRMTADCLPDNTASARILARLGMKQLGQSRTGLLLWELRRDERP